MKKALKKRSSRLSSSSSSQSEEGVACGQVKIESGDTGCNSGGCAGCGDGKARCDESCIRALAMSECQRTCGAEDEACCAQDDIDEAAEACQSDCCSQPQPESKPKPKAIVEKEAAKGCCASSASDDGCKLVAKPATVDPADCKQGCCSSSSAVKDVQSVSSCDEEPVKTAEATRLSTKVDSCCTSKPSGCGPKNKLIAEQEPKAESGCCGSKASTCCDEKSSNDVIVENQTIAPAEKAASCCSDKPKTAVKNEAIKIEATKVENNETSSCCAKDGSGCSSEKPVAVAKNEAAKISSFCAKDGSGCSSEKTSTTTDTDPVKSSGCCSGKSTSVITGSELDKALSCSNKKLYSCRSAEPVKVAAEKSSPCCDTKSAGLNIQDSEVCSKKNDACCKDESRNEKAAPVAAPKSGCCSTVNACCSSAKGSTKTTHSDHKVENSPEKKSCCAGEAKVSCGPRTNNIPCCAGKDTVVTSSLRKSSCASSQSARQSTSPSCSRAAAKKEPCGSHLQTAYDRYASYLQKGRCICRSVLDRLDTRCTPAAPMKKPAPAGLSKCALGTAAVATRAVGERICKDACCETTSVQVKNRACGKVVIRPTEKENSCQSSCCDVSGVLQEESPSCGIDKTPAEPVETEKLSKARAKVFDIEGGAAREHALLSVSGMTCTGCSRKVGNVLNNIDGLSSVKVTFVTGVAEFDFDQSTISLEQLLPRIEKETGFKFSPIYSNSQSLDLKMSDSVLSSVQQSLDRLVESMERLDKTTYRIQYDPNNVGARTVLASAPGAILAPPGVNAKLANDRKKFIKLACMTAISAALTIPVVVLAWSDAPVPHLTSSIVQFVLATLVQGLSIPEFYLGAIKALIYSRVLEMDMLVVISVTAAYGYSVVAFGLTQAGFNLETKAFFETSTLLITFVLLGRLVAALAKFKAVSAVSLRSLQADKALLLDDSGETTEIDARLLHIGDTLVVPTHSRIVTDGQVLGGVSSADESMLTGESLPVPKSNGDTVVAGTINGPGKLTVRATRLPGRNSITDIADLVENALAAKPRIQDLADTLAGYFIPVIIAIATIIFAIWIGIAIRVRGETGGNAVGTAITYGIAALAISCPCALGLAVPMVLVIAGGVAARLGVIIRQADVIERGHKVTDVVFDKTGTLTDGVLTIVQRIALSHEKLEEAEITSLAGALTKDNQHPVSLAVSNYLQATEDRCAGLEDVQSIPGSGIQCKWRGYDVKAGNPYWLGIEGNDSVSALLARNMTLFCITLDAVPVAIFGLKSQLRSEACNVVAELQRRGITCHIVSGDSAGAVEDVARTVGISHSEVASRRSPAQKAKYIKDLVASSSLVRKQKRTALFCGDGTNDAVAIAQADVGVQLGDASEVTLATADVVLLGGLDGLLALLDLSGRASRRIMFNFAWSAIYNTFAVLLAAGAFVKARIPPAYAGLGEIVSVSPVIIAALTLVLPFGGGGRARIGSQ